MIFGSQQWLWLLAAVPALWVTLRIADRRSARRLSALLGPRAEAHVEDRAAGYGTWRRILMLWGLAFLIIAIARPQWGADEVEVVQHGTDVVIALDISNSMLAQDVSPSRLVRARAEIASFLADFDRGQVGLVLFAGQAFVQCPLTLDLGAVELFLRMADTDMISEQGTALGAALETSVDMLAMGEDAQPTRRAVILVTDGENLEGSWEQAAERCVEEGVSVFPVGVGLETGGLVPLGDGQEGYMKDQEGNVVLSRLDADALAGLARATGGTAFRIGPGSLDRDGLGLALSGLGEHELTSRHVAAYRERYIWPLALSLLMLFLRFILRARRTVPAAVTGSLLILLFASAPVSAFDLLDRYGAEVNKAVDLYETGNYEEALELFESSRAERPDDPHLAMAVGETLARLERWDEASREFERALALGDEPRLQAEGHYNAGTAALNAGDLGGAVESLRRALDIEPDREDALRNLEHAMTAIEQQPPQQQQQGEEGEEGEDSQDQENQEQQNQEQEQQDQEQQTQQEQEEQQQDEQSEENQQEQQQERAEEDEPEQDEEVQPQPPEPSEQEAEEMSRQRAESILRGLDKDEEELRRSVRQRLKGVKPRSGRRW